MNLASEAASRVLELGSSSSSDNVCLTLQDINEHVLVGGVPGSGKSTTVRKVLRQLDAKGIPFLVLDPAKSDYRELSDIADCFDLSPDYVGFNPLAVPSNCSVRAHQARVLAALDSGLRLSEQWPLGRVVAGLALSATYAAAGSPERSVSGIRWPTLADLYRHARAVVREQGFSGEALSNIKASLLARIEFMIDGPLGDVLSGDHTAGIDWDRMTRNSTIIQMREIAGPDERVLVFSLLLAGLVGYREANPLAEASSPRLGHVTVLEEAHRLLASSLSSSYSSGLFADAIAELRGSGEGFMIVDQAPSLLISGVAKNTGSKISHRLTDANERIFMGQAMVLSESQTEDLSRLARGRVIVQTGSLPEPMLIEVNRLPNDDSAHRLTDVETATQRSFTANLRPVRPWCQRCPRPCEADPTDDEVAKVAPLLALARDDTDLNLYIREAAPALGITLPTRSFSEAMQLYCVSAKALSESYSSRDRRHNVALETHRRVFELVAAPRKE